MGDGFTAGCELNQAFYAEIVRPLLGVRPHAAALLGPGSDVLGFDTEVSTDHGWGPRLHVFVDDADVAAVHRHVEAGLPDRFRGWSVRFGWDGVPDQHHVRVGTLESWLRNHLGFDPRVGMSVLDWLTTPQQTLLEATRGRVYADHGGRLHEVRDQLRWFPPEVHRWLLACQWQRVAQEEAFVGRAAQVGDELGSHLIAARLAREVMRLGFLLARRYWPYPKWFGSAFSRLPIATDLAPSLRAAASATDHPARQAALGEACHIIAGAHNASGLNDRLASTTCETSWTPVGHRQSRLGC